MDFRYDSAGMYTLACDFARYIQRLHHIAQMDKDFDIPYRYMLGSMGIQNRFYIQLKKNVQLEELQYTLPHFLMLNIM